jgi:O-succinylbenzoic acid--CoA ligase
MAEIRCPLTIAAQEHGRQPALIDRAVTLTWQQVASAVDELANFLTQAGVEKADRVAIVENNRFELPILILALIRKGAVAVLLSPRYPEATLAMMAEKCRCRHHLFWSRGTREARLPSLKPLCLPNLSELTRVEQGDNNINKDTSLDTEQDATIIFTSGTSGEPKAALLSYGNHYYNALGSNENLSIAPGDRWLLSLPLYHVGGLGVLFRCLLGGGTVVMADSSVTIGQQIARDRITHVSMVPNQLRRLLDDLLINEARSNLKAILLGGAPVPSSLLCDAADSQFPVFLTYGLTETASQVATEPASNPTGIDRAGTYVYRRYPRRACGAGGRSRVWTPAGGVCSLRREHQPVRSAINDVRERTLSFRLPLTL